MSKRKILGWAILGMFMLVFTAIVAISTGWIGILFFGALFAVAALLIFGIHLIATS